MSETASTGAAPPAPETPPRRRRRRVFLVVWAACFLAVIWPVYPLVSRAFPLVLGLPLSLAWILAVLAVQFLALFALYRADERDAATGGEAS